MYIKRDITRWFLGLSLLLAGSTAAALAAQLEKSGPVVCSGEERLTIHNRHIEAREVGIAASGSCQIVLEDSEVVAGDVGIVTSDRAVVRIEDSRVTGESGGIHARGESEVSFRNSIITGGVREEDEAKARNAGGSIVR